MKRLSAIFFTIGLLVAVVFFVNPHTSNAQGQPDSLPTAALDHMPVCPPGPAEDFVRCHARVVVNEKGNPFATTGPVGYGPDQLSGAYNLYNASSSGRILAIVDAYDHPNIKSDLDTYSNQFGLPVLPTCTGAITASSETCFQKVDQNGGTTYPATDAGWALEIALDVEAAHAVCPDCKLLLVEANSSSYTNLMAAVDRAVTLGANVVSNSYGSREFSSETTYDFHFNKPGIAFTFSSGDSGYGTSYPAASRYVTAVGGTTLYVNSDNTYNSETAWKGSGSGCSSYESKPSWQKDSGCAKRTIADVSAVANPNTGAAIYNTVPYSGQTGWFQVGGTSLSAPIIAGVYALKGVPTATAPNSLPYLNSPSTNLHDITTGANGGCSARARYLCTSVIGFDGPTGLGTPNGINGF